MALFTGALTAATVVAASSTPEPTVSVSVSSVCATVSTVAVAGGSEIVRDACLGAGEAAVAGVAGVSGVAVAGAGVVAGVGTGGVAAGSRRARALASVRGSPVAAERESE